MFEELFGKASDVVFHKIAPYAVERQQFLEHCREQGFARTYLKRMAGILLTAAIDLQARGGLDVDQASLDAAATRIEKIRSDAGFAPGARGCSRAFLRITTRWLLFAGHLQEPAPRRRPYTAMLDDFAQWMGEERGLSPRTLTGRGWHLGKFLDWLHEHGRRVSDLGLRDLDAYLQHLHAKGLSRVTIRVHTSASWDEVRRLIEDAASDDPVDVRDRAILLLFAVYGLRAGEVASLRLEDIDWEHDRLTVRRSKPRRSQVYPLVPAVGQAVIRYLSEARPRCSFRELFLKTIAPVGPMSSTSLYHVVAPRIKRLGIQAPRRGPHVLRHACAGRLLARGLSLKEIGDHLGHRSPDSTRIYAKVDLQGLREVAAFDLGGLA